MNLVTLLHRPLFSRRARPTHLQFSPTGSSAFLAFPRWPELGESDALVALDAWLRAHPTCTVVLLNQLPGGRTLRRLQSICKRHGCAYMVRAAPQIPAAAQVAA
ncbi:MAG: hypothetical protein KY445_00970 [Armatimonadetes bacterium]|nr:hypothetical protein [Armatimonadota bacterium]